MSETADETFELLQRWHEGDRTALARLLERDRTWIEDRVRRRRSPALQGHDETVDSFQDLMLQALEYAPRFVAANQRQFRGLLARMIENQLIDKARKLQRRQGHAAMESLAAESRISLSPDHDAAMTPPDEAAARSEEIAWMRLGLEFLTPEDRQLVWKRQFEERSFVDIAKAGERAETLRMRFQRALLKLAGIIQRLQAGEVDSLLADDGTD